MTDRIETAAKALFEANSNYKWEQAPHVKGGFKERALREAECALAASDAILFSDQALDRVARELAAQHGVASEGWDNSPFVWPRYKSLAKGVIAALKGAGDE